MPKGRNEKQQPLIVESKLSKPSRWFVLTNYRERRGINASTGDDVSYLVALEKFDVTTQMRAILHRKKAK